MKDKWQRRFERWASSYGLTKFELRSDGTYEKFITRMAFDAWTQGLDDGVDDGWMFGGEK